MLLGTLTGDARPAGDATSQGQSAGAAADTAKRHAYLEQLRRVLPPSAPWEAWLSGTGELPPDFHALPSVPDLPDPLEGVSHAREWAARRDVLKRLFHQWMLGSVPPPPDNLRAEVTGERREEGGTTVREVRLSFGPEHKATLRLELLIPAGKGPFPVFMTQHNHRAWALIALRRGYIACVYAGADSRDDTDTFLPVYPEYDWSRLTRRAWAASRCIDYLGTVPQADAKRVALTGHSRNGKLSLIASALDERITVVISSSSGAGGTMPARYYAEAHFGEGIEKITRSFPDWFHPRLRFFSGREDKLPIDMHELVALSAPRPCLLSIALNDNVESSWAMEQTYLSAQRVYRLLDDEDNLRILWRSGAHETSPTVIERYLDWCDKHFKQANFAFPERLIHPHDEDAGHAAASRVNPADFPRRDSTPLLNPEQVRTEVRRMLGEAPPRATNPGGTYGREVDSVAALLSRRVPTADDVIEKQQIVFGDYINADVYLPKGLPASGRKAPAILYLHPFSSAQGYVAGYFDGEQVFRTLARQGFVVFCFDMIGYGRRIEEVEGFYQRHPRWSLLGKMVRDAQAALDVLSALPYVNDKQVLGLGYGLGSFVGLHLAALDERVTGLVSVAGPPPFRADTPDKGSGGIRRWSHVHRLLPRLGSFIGQEDHIPYDIPDLLASLAPRPVLVVSPTLDREARLPDVNNAVAAARLAYAHRGASERLEQASPEDYNRLSPKTQALIIEWLKKQTQ